MNFFKLKDTGTHIEVKIAMFNKSPFSDNPDDVNEEDNIYITRYFSKTQFDSKILPQIEKSIKDYKG